jgi:hypothetical protein
VVVPYTKPVRSPPGSALETATSKTVVAYSSSKRSSSICADVVSLSLTARTSSRLAVPWIVSLPMASTTVLKFWTSAASLGWLAVFHDATRSVAGASRTSSSSTVKRARSGAVRSRRVMASPSEKGAPRPEPGKGEGYRRITKVP